MYRCRVRATTSAPRAAPRNSPTRAITCGRRCTPPRPAPPQPCTDGGIAMAQIVDSKAEPDSAAPEVAGGARRGLPAWAITLCSLAVLLGVWEWFGRDINPVFGSYPSAIAVAFWDLARSGQLG